MATLATLLFGLIFGPAPNSQAALPAAPPGSAPHGIVTSTRPTVALVAWQPVPGSSSYLVEVAVRADMVDADRRTVNQSLAVLSGLSPATRYYVRVTALDEGGAAGPASSPVTVTTDDPVLPFAAPVPEVNSPDSTTLTATWTDPGPGLDYQTQFAEDSAKLAAAETGRTSEPSAVWDGLAPDSAYYLRIRAVHPDGRPASDWSTVAKVRTSNQAPLRVASFNVKCETCGGVSWSSRRGAVVSAVRSQDPDVIGIQEASQGWLSGARISQFEDLANRLGASYTLANAKRNNCVKHWTPSGCRYRDQGASQGTRIIYNSARLELLAQGSRRLLEASSGANDRYVAWAILRQRSTGKRFFFADTHLEPNASFAARNKQTRQVLATIAAHNPDRLPTVVVGDFNSHKWTKPSNGPYDIMRSAGFVDPLGNTYRSTTRAAVGAVERRINTRFSSYNDYQRQAPRFGYTNGTYLDYIFTTPMRVSEWETVVRVDSRGRFVGVIPSDHNMIRATVWLP